MLWCTSAPLIPSVPLVGPVLGHRFSTPIDSMRVTRYIYRLYQRASISGDLAALRTAEQATERALPLLVHKGDLYLLKGKIAFSLHRLADAEAALAAGPA